MSLEPIHCGLNPDERRELAHLARTNTVVRKLLRRKVQWSMGMDDAADLGVYCASVTTYRPWYRLFWGSLWWCNHLTWVWQKETKRTPWQTGWNEGHRAAFAAFTGRLR